MYHQHNPAKFEQFWDAYPLKEQREAAEAMYKAQIGQGMDPATIQKAVENYAHERRGEEPTYTKLAKNFLSTSVIEKYAAREVKAVVNPEVPLPMGNQEIEEDEDFFFEEDLPVRPLDDDAKISFQDYPRQTAVEERIQRGDFDAAEFVRYVGEFVKENERLLTTEEVESLKEYINETGEAPELPSEGMVPTEGSPRGGKHE